MEGVVNNTGLQQALTVVKQTIDAGGSTTPVVDNLTSNSAASALSAKQGSLLNRTKAYIGTCASAVANGSSGTFTLKSDANPNITVNATNVSGDSISANTLCAIVAYVSGTGWQAYPFGGSTVNVWDSTGIVGHTVDLWIGYAGQEPANYPTGGLKFYYQ